MNSDQINPIRKLAVHSTVKNNTSFSQCQWRRHETRKRSGDKVMVVMTVGGSSVTLPIGRIATDCECVRRRVPSCARREWPRTAPLSRIDQSAQLEQGAYHYSDLWPSASWLYSQWNVSVWISRNKLVSFKIGVKRTNCLWGPWTCRSVSSVPSLISILFGLSMLAGDQIFIVINHSSGLYIKPQDVKIFSITFQIVHQKVIVF